MLEKIEFGGFWLYLVRKMNTDLLGHTCQHCGAADFANLLHLATHEGTCQPRPNRPAVLARVLPQPVGKENCQWVWDGGLSCQGQEVKDVYVTLIEDHGDGTGHIVGEPAPPGETWLVRNLTWRRRPRLARLNVLRDLSNGQRLRPNPQQ